ncbi:MAG TPA: SDR family NAD(P)-dependent oxidoreductase [Pseudomonas xinjiangensis]|uniref:SDR family NAD(P)-dependent oxidoreductase n=2 Tax=root TaxID=1 RepID=A0A7V1BRE8_9GAMM|nr:SDR family NAD(P)-dependent oxidoreductase [Halopseudomonas xinjiangensis]HEC46220.1 SDR family NAD(P)-dependent oxidoreductase [Halopseudomonas xinjiangensis]
MIKTWFITGAGRGLGFHIAQAALAAGDNVVATGRNSSKTAQAFGDCGNALLCLELDVSRENDIAHAVDKAVEHFGGIDVMVNNAGFGQLGPFEENTATDAQEQFAINVFGLFDMCRAVIPAMRSQGRGHIFNIASIAGLAGMGGASLYCASKFAVVGFSEALAQELAGFGIQVTVVAPGGFRTDFLDSTSARFGSQSLPDYANFSEKVRASSEKNNHNQPGDPAKLGKALVQLAMAPQAPVHFVVGSDALELATGKLASRKQELEKWRDLTISTDS